MKTTAKAKKIRSDIDEFITYYVKAKGSKPKQIKITKDQETGLGVKCPFFYNSVKLER